MAQLDWQTRWYQLVRSMARVHSQEGEEQLCEWLLRPGEPRVLAFVNAHAMNQVAESDPFYQALMSADVVVRDGIGVFLLMRLLNQPAGQNLNGTDLIPKLLQEADGLPIALFGTREPWLRAARQNVRQTLAPNSPCVTANGFLELGDYIHLAAQQRPRVIVLGMGMPRQEEVAIALRAALGYPCLIVCGGAIIDFLGGKVPRAPRWMRRTGLEWAFRLGREPRRLWNRYVHGNPLFLGRALRMATRSLRQGWPAVA
ncbi:MULTISPECIES: WecB/TagA/CpsF family glycosyltransferase [Ramlibacter]|uniref:WecB/TagA/CpsF family glycosyltransferase n=1 Tax=Ramlibacter pinisoli TaxID=2682844 RepID=A0A6N8ISD6_9BURK|nr:MULTISPECIES: WecB/TagA/CpsF family glycosyltransferase [Ramlibacter]MBA2964529.1 WecB/TagA/CpsF family glycosyltransferase [Ramlibacter sp. CGMCC 1.13660]MVQ29495.1 WecB/TagA/CpsF family glycosyltransferase [Ramlibacter pinisoli]